MFMLFLCVVVFFCGMGLGYISGIEDMKEKAISAGHGHYNKGTGRFRFGMDPATLALKKINCAKKLNDLEAVHQRVCDAQETHINALYDDLDQRENEINKLKRKLKQART